MCLAAFPFWVTISSQNQLKVSIFSIHADISTNRCSKAEGIIWQCKWLWVINVGLWVKRLPSVSAAEVSHIEVLEIISKLICFFCCIVQGAFPDSETMNKSPKYGLRLWPWRFGCFSPGPCEPFLFLLRKLVPNHFKQLLLRGKPLCAPRSVGLAWSRYPGSCNPGHNVGERDWEVPLQDTYSAAKDIFRRVRKDSGAVSPLWAQLKPVSSWMVPTLHALG